MSFYRKGESLSARFRTILDAFLQTPGLPFADVLCEEEIQQVFEEEGVCFAAEEDSVYTPAVTLWAFLSQMLLKDEQRSCRAAVARIGLFHLFRHQEACSSNTGAYCRARAKLAERSIERLAGGLASACQQQVPDDWLWHGRHVHLVDGTTVSMPDTSANQAEYPQSRAQQEGLGFPIARMLVLFSLATGMLRGMAMGPCRGKETGETALLRQLLDCFRQGDVLLADRYYCSYFMIALLQELGVDFVVRMHQLRKVDFCQGRRLAKGDHVVHWMRPDKPEWMDQPTYDRMPESIEVREIQVTVEEPGFRTESLVVVTTLTDADEYPSDEIAELYRARWLVELDIRVIKRTLGMDVLRCKTPGMVRREMWMSLLAYNLVRRVMLQTALESGRSPRALSFTAALQNIAASWMMVSTRPSLTVAVATQCRTNLSKCVIGDRPGRIEPRAVKRRPKPHALLTKPRAEAKAELIRQASP